MTGWEELDKAESEKELKALKLWLFKENIRLQNERKDLEKTQEKFAEERSGFRREMDEMNRHILLERKRLREETLFFDKKMAILQEGFKNLELDRKQLERERRQFEAEKRYSEQQYPGDKTTVEDTASILFRGLNNTLALRKRYKDLMKIFHPDNLFGDAELVQMINREYARRKKEEE